MSQAKKMLLVLAVMAVALLSHKAHAASLSFAPAVSGASIGDTLNVGVRIDSQGQTVNAVQGTIDYPNDILQVVRIDHGNSIFNIWAQEPAVNTSTGEIAFLGGATNSFSGGSLYVFNITFTVRGSGLATLDFKNAGVTAGDGTGANILSSSTIMSFRVGGPSAAPGATSTAAAAPQAPPPPQQIVRPAAPAAKAPTAPVLSVSLYSDQSKWYSTIGNFLAQWQLPADITNVATALNQNPQFDPTVSEGLFDNKTFGAVKEGVWYLHVRSKNSVGWGPTAHYRIAVDTTPPFPFTAETKEGSTTEVPTPTLLFSTQDQPSGVAFYQILADGSIVGTTTNASFTLPPLSFGSHDLAVEAVDYANNVTESRLSVTIAQPAFYRILADGSIVGTTTNASFTLPPLSFGSHDLAVEAVDYADNVTESRLSVTIAQPAFLVIAGIKITGPIFFGTIIAVLILGFIAGFLFYKKREEKLALRVVFTESEASKIFKLIEQDVENISKARQTSTGTDDEYALDRLKENLKKMESYLEKGIEKINK